MQVECFCNRLAELDSACMDELLRHKPTELSDLTLDRPFQTFISPSADGKFVAQPIYLDTSWRFPLLQAYLYHTGVIPGAAG
jgi:hypothetical protein